MSTSAWRYCPDCDIDKRDKDYDKPFSFVKGLSCSCASKPKWKLRKVAQTLADLERAHVKIKCKKKRVKFMRAKGYRVKGVRGVCAAALHVACAHVLMLHHPLPA